MTPAEIETLLKEVEEEVLEEKPKGLKKLGIDEITHLKGGKNYAAILVDLDKRKPIAFLERRNREVIAEYLLGLGSEILNQIEEVSIDLWKPYQSECVILGFPQNVRRTQEVWWRNYYQTPKS
jgi:transposase